jgi:hypothetical protein
VLGNESCWQKRCCITLNDPPYYGYDYDDDIDNRDSFAVPSDANAIMNPGR